MTAQLYTGMISLANLMRAVSAPRVHLAASSKHPSLCGMENDRLSPFQDDRGEGFFDPDDPRCCTHCRGLHLRATMSGVRPPSKRPVWASGRAYGVFLRPGAALYPKNPSHHRLAVVSVHGTDWAIVNYMEGACERLREEELKIRYQAPAWICKTNTPETIAGVRAPNRGF